MVDFRRKSMGLKTNATNTVKKLHNLGLSGALGIGLGKWRGIGWGGLLL